MGSTAHVQLLAWRTGQEQKLVGAGVGGAIKAERVCQLVLPGVCTCSPVPEGILLDQVGWLPTCWVGQGGGGGQALCVCGWVCGWVRDSQHH